MDDLAHDEIPLSGGNANGSVVRVGDTVHRKVNTASPAVHGLLLHLEQRGFNGCPHFLGIDASGREMLSFLPGEVGFPSYLWQSDSALIAAAQLLRRYHDATVGYIPSASCSFSSVYPDPTRHEVICHNDFAPYNLVCDPERGVPYAIIDFDLAGPGPRLRDVAYACYWLVPLAFGTDDLHELALSDVINGSSRLRTFCDMYGIALTTDLFDMVEEVLQFAIDWLDEGARIGDANRIRMIEDGHLAGWQKRKHAFLHYRIHLVQACFGRGDVERTESQR